ncbi:AraC family transcriptional regulator [Halarcobacter sp.]|uniref:helix-turn-helix domain-containing protein n=1 Tax=Halarcobacter sp. TaxID=2321133 RepID=UPI002AAA6D81|nr:AraC family transcriptional regulator [Halarcobacter sp.]
MTNLSKSKLYETGKTLIKNEKSKSFIKQIANINNQFINLNIVNVMVEDNIYLNIVDNTIKQSYIQKLSSKKKQLQIRIVLQGQLEKLDQNENKKIVYKENEISVEYKHNIEESLLNKKGQHIKYICITLNENYLNENGYFSDFFKKNFSKKFYEPDLKNRFEELLNREYTNGLDKIYLKNKTMEIILYVINRIQRIEKLELSGLDEEDIKRVKKAKILLEDRFNEKLTIPILSKEVALNQSKLKTGFKKLFNTTIHEYLKNIRLQKAVEYLKSNRYTVKEVSIMVGYTNQGSFSYAFSNKYNCSPKDIQKNSLL